ncbi:MAG TPA: universal stress protein [bacterium]|nr:universal stress protein [bacterium]
MSVKSVDFTKNRAVVASSFSPRALALLNEAQPFLACLSLSPVIVHAGEPSAENRERMAKMIEESRFAGAADLELVMRNGAAEEVLLQAAREYRADFIVAGVLPREGFFKYYLGSVGRNLARQAPCSVLLHINPADEPVGFRKIHHAVEYHRSIDTGVDLAAKLAVLNGARDLYFTHAFRIPDSVLKKNKVMTPEDYKKIYGREDRKLQQYLSKQLTWDVPYHVQSLYERDNSPSLAFARDIGADLFVIHAPKKEPGLWDRLFPNDLEQTLHDLPCSILIARSRVSRRR